MDFPCDAAAFTARDWRPPDVEGCLRLAVVGLGNWTQSFALPSAADAEYCRVTAVVSRSAEKADRVAAEHGIEHAMTYAAFHEGAVADAYDAVYVVTPHATHLDVTETAAGLDKHVLCEKPMEATVDRAERMCRVCAEAGVTLAVGYRMQLDPAMRRLRELVADGYIGEPVQLHGGFSERVLDLHEADQWRFDPDLAGGGALYEIGVYPINTSRFLLGRDPTTVQASVFSPDEPFGDGIDEHVAFQLTYPGDVTGSFTASFNAQPDDRLQLLGTEGQLRIEPAFLEKQNRTITVERDDTRFEYTGPFVDEVTELLDHFAAAVLTDVEPEPDGRDGLVDMRVMEAIPEADATGRRITL